MEKLLQGKVCVVTGGSRGIGCGIAKAFAEQGAEVIITYRSNRCAADETVSFIEETFGVSAFAVQADAGKEEDVQQLAAFVKKQYGAMDVLVNNAGTIGVECASKDLDLEAWDCVMQTDLRGVFLHCKYLIPLFRKNSVGKIINISSELSLKGRAGYLAYTAAKGAVNAMTRSLALELAPDILVNTLAPGPVETDMILKEMDDVWIEKEKDIPLRRLGTVQEIAATAVLLASAYGDFYCGQFISPNGGSVFTG